MTEIQQQFNTAPCIAVNCAGITKDNFVLDMNESQWDSVMNVNLKVRTSNISVLSHLKIESIERHPQVMLTR